MAPKNEEQSLIASKLDMLVKLQAHAVVNNLKSQKDKIIFLNRVGMQPKEIAEILGTSPNFVSVTLSKVRKSEKSVAASTSASPED
jgi:DNA-directed RNA polymerase specialized sigma24 family protein